MVDIVSSIGLRSLRGIVQDRPRPLGIRSWLKDGSYVVSNGSVDNGINLENIIITEFMSFLSFDFQRFSLAGRESICRGGSVRGDIDPLSWTLIRAYYGAFYGSHSILRALGQSFVRIDSPLAIALKEVAALYGASNAEITAGNYFVRIGGETNADPTVSMVKIKDSFGGSHEAFWSVFNRFLERLAVRIASEGSSQETSAVAILSEIRTILNSCGFNQGNWLSSIRNEITYQHLHGVWMPMTAKRKEIDYIEKYSTKDISTIRLDFEPRKSPLSAFFSCCMCLAQLSSQLAEFLIKQDGQQHTRFANSLRAFGKA